jgi:chemotaxis protein MotB
MSADGDATAAHEVVIVRRRGGEGDDGHHGGAWKIAFADLMTAMMAFFLVMWLLNVSDKEKIQQIATYFNPLKLNSKRPTVKGIQESQETPKAAPSENAADDDAKLSAVDGTHKKKGGAASGGDGVRPEGSAQQAEEELFNDPYGVLARLAATAAGQSSQTNVSKDDTTLNSGDSYSNPFDPFAGQARAPPKSVQSEHEQLTLAEPGRHPSPPGLEPSLEVSPEAAKDAASASAAAVDKTVEALSDALTDALKGLASDKKPEIEVKRVDEGVLISLTDDFRFGMFDSASAQPRPELVVVMEKVAKVLASYDGGIILRGHTDARPFRTERNNNWRLSMERAQMAYYMLVRGGVSEVRFESIEGHADRALKIASDPAAAQNRRIEILVRPKP